MTIVREDKHGLYLKTGGYLFRPVFPVGYRHVHKDGTRFSTGDKVTARHIGGSPLGTVKQDNYEEVWFSHGDYLTTKRPSNDIYKPDYENWG